MKRLCVFASGSGTDFQSVIDGVNTGKIDGKIVLLVASRPDIYAVERAKKNGIEVAVFRKKDYESAEKMYDALIPVLKEKGVELIILAGYLTVLTQNIVAAYRDKIINIHPALLPKHGGKGMYGMHVHEAVVAAGEKESGITIHYINENYDEGDIIFQAKCEVLPADTPEEVATKVHALEYDHYPHVIDDLLK